MNTKPISPNKRFAASVVGALVVLIAVQFLLWRTAFPPPPEEEGQPAFLPAEVLVTAAALLAISCAAVLAATYLTNRLGRRKRFGCFVAAAVAMLGGIVLVSLVLTPDGLTGFLYGGLASVGALIVWLIGFGTS